MKRSFLVYGQTGTGKTSFVARIAFVSGTEEGFVKLLKNLLLGNLFISGNSLSVV